MKLLEVRPMMWVDDNEKFQRLYSILKPMGTATVI
jgi:hypothetical protein